MIEVYTDASWCQDTYMSAGAFIIMDKKESVYINKAFKIGKTESTEEAEATTLLKAITKLLTINNKHVTFFVDNWNLVYTLYHRRFDVAYGKTAKLITNILTNMYKYPFLITYIKGHNGNEFNNWCDRNANKKLNQLI